MSGPTPVEAMASALARALVSRTSRTIAAIAADLRAGGDPKVAADALERVAAGLDSLDIEVRQ